MPTAMVLEWLVLVIGFYMAWNIGANDVSNAMGTSVGSGALTLKRAVILAAVLEFAGAFFVGANVSETMQKGLIDTTLFISDPLILVLGMCGALLGTSLWLQIASYFGWPVSTTHAIVGAILGFGIVIGGVEGIQWEETLAIGISWVVSPLTSATVSFLLFSLLQKKVLYALKPLQAATQLMPLFVFIVFSTFTLSLVFNGLQNLNLQISFPFALFLALLVGGMAALISFWLVRRNRSPEDLLKQIDLYSPQMTLSLDKAIKHLQRVRVAAAGATHTQVEQILHEVKALKQTVAEKTTYAERSSEYHAVEKMFVYLQILSACYVAFAHGANDVANAIGPVAAVLNIIKSGEVTASSPVPSWLLAIGGFGIVVGLATWGWRVIETVGKKITELTPTRGFCAEFGAATTILVASKCGLPISTTHCLVGAVLGVGFGRGIKAINLTTVKEIVLSWVITIPASALMSLICFYLLKMAFV